MGRPSRRGGIRAFGLGIFQKGRPGVERSRAGCGVACRDAGAVPADVAAGSCALSLASERRAEKHEEAAPGIWLLGPLDGVLVTTQGIRGYLEGCGVGACAPRLPTGAERPGMEEDGAFVCFSHGS